jgi:hypothetical protein
MPLSLTYDEVKALEPCSKEWRRVSKLLGGKKGWNGKRIDAAQRGMLVARSMTSFGLPHQ